MRLIKNNWTYLLGMVLGALAGFLYWKFIGCNTGSCPITSSPTISTLYGVMMGGLVGGICKGLISRN